jgi:hypothetical protein
MAGFIYYLPDVQGPAGRSIVAERGLDYAIGKAWSTAGVQKGPDGGQGLIVCDTRSTDAPGYYPDRQEWVRRPDGRVWVGRPIDQGIGPEDLSQEEPLPGRWCPLNDGQDWVVPIARGLAIEGDDLRWYCALPEALTLDPQGHWQSAGVIRRYEPLWRLACDWWDHWRGKSDRAWSLDDRASAAIQALQANYRIGPIETSLLRILDSTSIERILAILIDDQVAVEFAKKKLIGTVVGGSSSTPGSAD